MLPQCQKRYVSAFPQLGEMATTSNPSGHVGDHFHNCLDNVRERLSITLLVRPRDLTSDSRCQLYTNTVIVSLYVPLDRIFPLPIQVAHQTCFSTLPSTSQLKFSLYNSLPPTAQPEQWLPRPNLRNSSRLTSKSRPWTRLYQKATKPCT